MTDEPIRFEPDMDLEWQIGFDREVIFDAELPLDLPDTCPDLPPAA